MRIAHTTLPLFLVLGTPAFAAAEPDCQSLWKTLDVDANGALESGEDKRGYIAAIEKSGIKLMKPGIASRDEFIGYCKTNIADVNTQSPANTKDMGKGDLTPGKNPLSEQDARKKLEASGFKDVRALRLDEKGIWHATAQTDGKEKPVSIDPQGDIVDQEAVAPVQDRAATSAPAEKRSDTMADGDAGGTVVKGTGATSGLFVWIFLLVGNALALLFLDRAGGPTSVMGGSSPIRTDRM